MDHKKEIKDAVEATKVKLEGLRESFISVNECYPDEINGVFFAAANAEGTETVFQGTVIGDAPSIVALFVGALQADQKLAAIMVTALDQYASEPCNCPRCTAKREQENIIKNQN